MISDFKTDFYESYIPAKLALRYAIDTAESHGVHSGFEAAKAFFTANPDRHLFLRKANVGEYHFDFRLLGCGKDGTWKTGAGGSTVEDATLYHPLVLVMIEKIAVGRYLRRPIWMGSPHSQEFNIASYTSDDALQALANECSLRGHGDEDAVNRFLVRFRKALLNDKAYQANKAQFLPDKKSVN